MGGGGGGGGGSYNHPIWIPQFEYLINVIRSHLVVV